MQNHHEVTSNSLYPKRDSFDESWNLDMSGPAWASLGGQILVSRVWFSFVFLPRTYTFPFYYQLRDFNQNELLSTFIFPTTK